MALWRRARGGLSAGLAADSIVQRLGLRARLLDRTLKRVEFGAKPENFVLGGEAGDVGARRAAAREQRDGEDEGSRPRRRSSRRAQRAFVRKWARRFLAQHASLCSVQSGRSSP